jgi:lysophospholipase L1-like esterase
VRVLKSVSLLLALLVVLTLAPNGGPAGSTVAGAPTDPSMSEAAAHGPSYVAMGSSFAAGPGIAPAESGGPSKCERSAGNYANLVAKRLRLGLTDVTCSGATTASILTAAQDGQPPQIDALRASTRLVTVTIGGNDIDYFGSLAAYSCHDGGGRTCHAVNLSAINRALSVATRRLEDVVTAIHTRAPRARVLLVNYFTVLPSSGGTCTGVPLSTGHLRFERSLASALAEDTATAARATGATLVDLASASEQHNACSAQPWVNRYVVTEGHWAYHPTAAGMAGAARLIERTLGADDAQPKPKTTPPLVPAAQL